jgi:hypothetical protein
MFDFTRMKPLQTLLAVLLAASAVLALGSGIGSAANSLEISDDASFRRAMLKSSAVFTFEPVDVAVDHWVELWAVSRDLDETTRRGRHCLLVAAVAPVLERATDDQAVNYLRHRLEADLDSGELIWDESCDCPVLPGQTQSTPS